MRLSYRPAMVLPTPQCSKPATSAAMGAREMSCIFAHPNCSLTGGLGYHKKIGDHAWIDVLCRSLRMKS